jgi:microcystin-dependent protein
MFCEGQQLPISENEVLFQLIGTTYGGDGEETFNLPNLASRVPIHMGNSHTLGEAAGSPAVTITQQNMPQHMHMMQGIPETPPTAIGNSVGTGKTFAQGLVGLQGGGTAAVSLYGNPANLVPMGAEMVTNTGGSQPHNNMMPYLALNFCIALQGIFPSQN